MALLAVDVDAAPECGMLGGRDGEAVVPGVRLG